MTLHAPQIIVLIFMAMGIVLQTSLHGQDRPPYNGVVSFLGALTTFGLLYWGGFFG